MKIVKTFILESGKYIRNITKDKKIYEEVNLENTYHSYIDKDMISQKIVNVIQEFEIYGGD